MLPSRFFGGLRPAWCTARTLSRSSYKVQVQRQLGASRANSSAPSIAKPQGEPSKSPPTTDTLGQTQADRPEPRLAIAFTCTADGCNHRSAHTFTKRSYERGIVIIQCPNCKNRHLIADNLGWFKDDTQDGRLRNIEDILRSRGERVQRGSLDAEGVVEISDH
ncbi:DNL zinc finger-domain-containing protein [Boletus coccyginus]|nr:DNL zinc finger-domain-containing protein [Boletus coccyginus]